MKALVPSFPNVFEHNLEQFFCVGFSYHQTPLVLRERLALPGEQQANALRAFRQLERDSGIIIVNTCNRVEFYLDLCPFKQANLLPRFFQVLHWDFAHLSNYLYQHQGLTAFRHLLSVISSMDSMALGEAQISGQVKQAFLLSHHENTVSRDLSMIFMQAFAAAKRIRTQSQIGAGSLSLSHIAVSFVQRVFDDLESSKVLLLGAGEMAQLIVEQLQKHQMPLTIMNRSLEKAQSLAKKYGAAFATMNYLESLLCEHDIVLSSLFGSYPLIDSQMLRTVLKKRKYKPLFLLDLSVPRSIEGSAADIDGIYLYNIDDLNQIAALSRKNKEKSFHIAQSVLEKEVLNFKKRLAFNQYKPWICNLKKHSQEVVEKELEKALRNMGSDLNQQQIETMKRMAFGIANKITHLPIATIRQQIEQDA